MEFKQVKCSELQERFRPKQGKPIVVNEIFGPTIQGEGKSIGKEVMFLRTSGCNLACIWCDTPYTWNWKGTRFQHPEKYERKNEVQTMQNEEIIAKLKELSPDVRSLVLSGGEPLLQQNKLVGLLTELKQDNYWIEVETNGTVVPTEEFIELVDQINCSPKLSNSGPDNTLQKRENPQALEALAQLDKTNFKFVVTNDEDLKEIFSLVERYKMREVYLMPEGRTKIEQEEKQTKIAEMAKSLGVNFSPRLHILLYGAKRAV